ncbi:MAG: zinc-ribbon domain-containing protein [Gammaproteobacteria bacterium]
MHCVNCGTKLSDEVKFCSSCGAGVVSAEAENVTEESCSAEQSEEAKKAEDKKNERIGAIFGLLLVGGWWMWSSMGDDSANSDNFAAQSDQSRPSAYDSGLQRHAIRLVNDRSVGVAGLCDKLYDLKFNQVTEGTLKANSAGSTRFPGMVANVEYMCVNPITGDRQKKTDFWLIFGHDEIGGQLRCAKVAGRPFIEGLMSDCDFKEGAG